MTVSLEAMSGAGLVVLLVKATILLCIALGASLVLQRASAGARHLVWVAIVAALLVLPALTAWSPIRLAVLPATPARVANLSAPASTANVTGEATPSATGTVANAVGSQVPDSETGRTGPLSVWRSIAYIWLGVALAVAAWLALGFFAVRRIVRQGRPLDDRGWTTPLYEIADRLGISATPRLLQSDAIKMPFACGLVTPTIVLPPDCHSWDLDRRRAVLMHELAHIRRRDLVGHTLGRLACAVYWFHPLVWTAVRRLRIESERACDDLALVCGLRPSNYAEHLLDIVSNVGRTQTPAIAIPMAHRREFEGRMLAILDPDVRRRTERRHAAVLLTGLLALVVVVGAAAPVERNGSAAGTADPARLVESEEPTADTPISRDVTLGAPLRRGDGAQRSAATPDPQPRLLADERETQTSEREVERERDIDVAQLLAQDTTRDRASLLTSVLRSDTSANLRRVAAWGLSRFASRSDVSSALAEVLRRDNNAQVREMAAWALAHGNDRSDVVEALSQAVRRDADSDVRESAAWALGNIDADAAADALGEAINAESARLRMLAIWALGNSSPKTAPRALVNALSDSDKQVRMIAAWALFRIQDPESVPALEQALARDDDRQLRMGYIRALGAIGERSSSALARLIDSRDPEVREVVVEALAGKGGGPWPWPWPQPRPYP